jgi:hypothetical protein
MWDLEEIGKLYKKIGFSAILQIMVSVFLNCFPNYDFCLVEDSKTKL